VKKRVDLPRHFALAGKAPGPSRMLEKLMWVKAHEPQSWARTAKVIQAKDYIAWRMTGEICTDYSDASATYLFDREKHVFSEELLSLGGIEKSKMPDAVPSATVIGLVSGEAARQTGLLAGTPVVIGAGDVAASTVGAGCMAEKQMYFCIGSSAWCAVTMDHAAFEPERAYSVLHAVEGLYINQCTLAAAGISYKWVKNLLGLETYEQLNAMAAHVPAGARGIHYLPYLLGDQSLFNNGSATGALLGLRAEHGQAEISRAVLEGVCGYLAASARLFEKHTAIEGMPVLLGGAAKGDIWSRILSDMLSRPCAASACPEEGTALGAAIIGGVAVGLFADYAQAGRLIRLAQPTAPEPEAQAAYVRKMQLFEPLYRAIEPFFEQM